MATMGFSSMNHDHRFRARRLPGHGTKLHPADWAVESGAVGDVLRGMNDQLRRRRRQRLRAFAASMIGLLCASFVWHHATRPGVLDHGTSASSAVVALPERQILSDGTIVELKHGAQVSVAYTDSVRQVSL